MATASWKGIVIAESAESILFDGNRYFPVGALKMQFFRPSEHHATCFWKGVASYYTVVVDGEENVDAAWFYPEPSREASKIKGYVAFWKGIEVSRD